MLTQNDHGWWLRPTNEAAPQLRAQAFSGYALHLELAHYVFACGEWWTARCHDDDRRFPRGHEVEARACYAEFLAAERARGLVVTEWRPGETAVAFCDRHEAAWKAARDATEATPIGAQLTLAFGGAP